MLGIPAAEVHIDLALVAALIHEQFPQYAGHPLRHLASGWDNVIARLGTDLLVRLPRRKVAVSLTEHEQRWLPVLAPRLPMPVPEPIHGGRPSPRFPWPWSITRWIPGESADVSGLQGEEALRLAAFLKALHRPAPEEAPTNPVRGVSLATRAAAMAERMARLEKTAERISADVVAAWRAALEAPVGTERHWLHGDLHPANILGKEGRIVGVIDWGDLCGDDIATDLAALWMLFDRPERQKALAAYGYIDAATLARAKGWAVFFGVVLLDTGLVDDERQAKVGTATLARITTDR